MDITEPLEPDLLFVCRAIRTEALCMFYAENTFHLDTINCDSDLDHRAIGRTRHMIQRERLQISNLKYQLRVTVNNPDWAALKVWVRRVYDKSVVNRFLKGGVARPARDLFKALMNGLFTMVAEMRDAGVRWEVVEKMVDAQHEAFVFADPRWALPVSTEESGTGSA